MFTTTINFPSQYIGDDLIELKIIFEHNTSGINRVWSAREKEIVVESWGDYHLGYNVEKPLMTPSTMKLTLGDNLGYLDSLLFEDDLINLNTDVRAEVIYTLNGVERFSGNIIEDSIDNTDGHGIIKFEAAPDTSILNQTMLYDEYVEDPTPSDSSNDNYYNAINPLGYTRSSYVSIPEIIKDIYAQVYKYVDVQVDHNWTFKGEKETYPPFGEFDGFLFTELLQNVDPLFFDNSKGINNLGDVLKKMALDWGCFTGMLNKKKAFFRKLFSYDADNLQDVQPIARKKQYQYSLLEYVRAKNLIGGDDRVWEAGTYTKLDGKFIERDALPGFWADNDDYPYLNAASNVKANTTRPLFKFECTDVITIPTKGSVYENNGSFFEVSVCTFSGSTGNIYTERISGTNDPTSSGTLSKVSGSGDVSISFTASSSIQGKYHIWRCRAPEQGNTLKDSGQAYADFWYNFRSNIRNCRVDKIICRKIGIDYFKNFHAYGDKYQIVDLKEFPPKKRTELLAINLGRVDA